MQSITTDNAIPLLSRALDQAGRVIGRVRSDQATLPTPCRSWDLGALIHHVVDEVYRFAAVTGADERKQPDALAGDDWAAAYRVAAESLLAAWRQPGALDRPQRQPFGDRPASWAVGQQITELAIHAWDIARASGQSTELDPELGHLALDWGKANLRPEFRGDEAAGYHVGPEVSVPADAPLYDRIAAFGGRDPSYRSTELPSGQPGSEDTPNQSSIV